MLEIKITKKDIEKTSERLFDDSKFTISSHGKEYGLLAEQIFLNNFGGELIGSRGYDIWLPPLNKIDVKTKVCRSEPLPHYTCSVSAYQQKNDSDYYVFFRMLKDKSKCWILGCLPKQEFFDRAEFVKAGTRDGGFLSKIDMYSIEISELRSVFDEIYRS